MLFNSLEFFIFFGLVYGLYLVLSHKWQNRMLLIASYIFYAGWDWRFLSLIWISTLVDYWCGFKIDAAPTKRAKKYFLLISLGVNFSVLGFFKYFNFFTSSLIALFNEFGCSLSPSTLNIILPMGISFYTFQTLSYSIDIYRGQLKPHHSFSEFALFVSFFPQLVAGPIERAKHLLPQITTPRKVTLNYFYEGCYLIFWGLFLKVFIADNLAEIADGVFKISPGYHGFDVLTGIYAFSFQIFCDFAGYSSMARGLAKCMGFDLMLNFNLPYFASNPRDFWRRWHISLSTWLRDYLYIPLGGNQGGALKVYTHLWITMFLGGLWHGAAWTFIAWGLYHGLLLILYRMVQPFTKRFTASLGKSGQSIYFGVSVVFFYHLVCLGWLMFRAESFEQMRLMMYGLAVHWEGFQWSHIGVLIGKIGPYIYVLLGLNIIQFWKKDLMVVFKWPFWLRAIFYYGCTLLIIFFGKTGANAFIYFQF